MPTTIFPQEIPKQTYQNNSESEIVETGRKRLNSVTSNHSIRSYDSTGQPPRYIQILVTCQILIEQDFKYSWDDLADEIGQSHLF